MKLPILLLLLIFCGCGASSQEKQPTKKTDTLKTNWPNGKLKYVAVLKNGLQNGLAVSYFPSGELRSKTFYVNDEIPDSVTYYHKNGRIEHIDYFNRLNYTYTSWYSNGNIYQKGNRVNGKESGEWILNYPNGQLWTSSFYVNSVKANIWKYYTPDGKLYKSESYLNDTLLPDKNSRIEISGNDTTVIDGWKREYNSSSLLEKEEQYSKGVKNGYSIEYFEGGDVKSISYYKNGLLEGKQFTFYPNPYIKSVSYFKSGKEVGDWIYYDEQGNITKKEKH